MKVTKNCLNQIVRVIWEDPRGGGDRLEITKAPKGKHALASWEEYGICDDITDGVMRIQHSRAWTPGESEPDEAMFSWVPEDLITDIKILKIEGGENAVH